jgi:hypothetical protein
MTSLLSLYQSGKHAEAWRNIQDLGGKACQPPLREDVWAVANETMRRAQSNLIVIVSRLQDLKYEFSATPFEKPGDDAEQMIELLDSRLDGGLPISLRAWFHWVGAVDFMGRHSALCFIADQNAPCEEAHRLVLADPLVIAPIEKLVADFDDWEAGYWGDQAFTLELSPDDLHKANISGASYDMESRSPCGDAVFGDWHEVTFVEYLRAAFQWGGFPGWERYPDAPVEELNFLAKDLLPI